jgi:hypothetical protein
MHQGVDNTKLSLKIYVNVYEQTKVRKTGVYKVYRLLFISTDDGSTSCFKMSCLVAWSWKHVG